MYGSSTIILIFEFFRTPFWIIEFTEQCNLNLMVVTIHDMIDFQNAVLKIG